MLISPSLPDFGQSFGAALFDEEAMGRRGSEATTTTSIAEVDERDDDGSTPQAISAPFTASDSSIASSSNGKPQNLHLGLRESPSLSSRFSNFSSALVTPEGSDDPSKVLSRPTGSSATSRSSRGEGSSGIGIGFPDMSSEMRNRYLAAITADPLQTPEKFNIQNRTPSGTPRVYDRAGQIGIGELATPRWNFPTTALPNWKAAAEATPLSATKIGQRRNVSGALTDDGTAPDPLSTSVPSSHDSAVVREADHKLSDGPQHSRRGEAARHSRSISYSSINSMQRNALRDPKELISNLPISPSVPGRHMPLGGSSSLHTLARGYPEKQSEFMAEPMESPQVLAPHLRALPFRSAHAPSRTTASFSSRSRPMRPLHLRTATHRARRQTRQQSIVHQVSAIFHGLPARLDPSDQEQEQEQQVSASRGPSP